MNWSLIFRYDASSGSLQWIPVSREHFTTNASHARHMSTRCGHIAGSKERRPETGKPKCVRVRWGKSQFLVHRIIWEMINGPIPDGMEIDHIDLDPWNNRIENLRLATHMENMANQGIRNSKTGLKGVRKTLSGRFQAMTGVMGKKKAIGTYDTPEEAHAAYVHESRRVAGQFARP